MLPSPSFSCSCSTLSSSPLHIHTVLLLLCDFCSLPFVSPLNNVISSVKFYSIHSGTGQRVAHFIGEKRDRERERKSVLKGMKRKHTHRVFSTFCLSRFYLAFCAKHLPLFAKVVAFFYFCAQILQIAFNWSNCLSTFHVAHCVHMLDMFVYMHIYIPISPSIYQFSSYFLLYFHVFADGLFFGRAKLFAIRVVLD